MNPLQHGFGKYFASLMGRELCRLEDDLGPVQVTQRGDRRVLSFGSPMEQSSVLMSKPWYLDHEYTQVMLLALVFVDARSVTLMGLGGGGLVHCLHHFYPRLKIQVVELRQAVIDLAYEWFELPQDAQVQVSQGDARQYVAQLAPASTDIIFSDLYDAMGMSQLQVNRAYLDACYRALSDEGWLVLNFHALPDEDSAELVQLRELFAEIYVCNVVKGNWIMLCGKNSCRFDRQALQQRTELLLKRVSMPLMYYFKQLRPVS
jgi:hypothetical protein